MLKELRPAWIEVDLDAVAANTRQLKGFLGKVELLAVVKADAYGLGAPEVAPVLLRSGVSRLGVVIPDEGIELRRAGIKAPILVMAAILPERAGVVLEHDFEQAVTSTELAEALSAAARKAGRPAIVHLKVDTGMGRYGVRFSEAAEWIERVRELPGLVIAGAMTHFSTGDAGDRTYRRTQLERFLEVRRAVEGRGIRIPTWHIANSGGTLGMPEAHLDMVRNGLVLYGYYPSDEVPRRINLRPAMALRARITSLRAIPAGDSVGYSRRYIPERDELVGVLPVGYADGLDRRLLRKGEAIIRGRRVPIVSGLCMDSCFVKLTDVPGVAVGDTLTLMGIDGNEEISPHEIAGKTGTVSYDVIAGFSRRLPRVYLQGGRPVMVKSMLTDWQAVPVEEVSAGL